MDTLEKYRDGDYDPDPFFDKTTSWPEGLQEKDQFLPNLRRPVRRANSADDIQRFSEHFHIAQRNQGNWFKWSHYLQILRDDLRHFDTRIIMSKAMLERLASSPRESEMSHYVTASEAEIIAKPSSRDKIVKMPPVCRRINVADAESVSSMATTSIKSPSSVDGISISSNLSMSPQKNLLKKFCSEIRQLAAKTYKTVEKISVKSKYCSACGDYIGNTKRHKDCSQQLNLIDKEKPIISSVAKNRILIRKTSVTSIASAGSGESTMSAQTTKKLYASYNKKSFPRRMRPFVKEIS